MGRNLAHNFARNGYKVAIHNRTYAKTEAVMDQFGEEAQFIPTESIADFVAALTPASRGNHGEGGRSNRRSYRATRRTHG